MSLFHRLGHMQFQPLVKVGDWVKRGEIIGHVGSTGNSTGPHMHYDIMKSKPLRWSEYTSGMSLAQVMMQYLDPAPFIKNAIPVPNTLPLAGYRFLEREPTGIYHPGEDCNSLNDLGKPVLAPCDGRVVNVFGTSYLKAAFGKLIGVNWNNGWGNCVTIEMDPNFDINKVI